MYMHGVVKRLTGLSNELMRVVGTYSGGHSRRVSVCMYVPGLLDTHRPEWP